MNAQPKWQTPIRARHLRADDDPEIAARQARRRRFDRACLFVAAATLLYFVAQLLRPWL